MSKTIYLTTQAQAQALVQLQLGKCKLPVASVTTMFQKDSARDNIKGYRGSYLINFKAVEPRNIARLQEAFEHGELAEADISGMTFSHEVLVTDSNPNPVLPCKGDIIEANIAFAMKDGEYVLGKIDGKQIMNITSYQVPVAKELKTLNLFGKATEEAKEGIPNTSDVTSEVTAPSAF